MIALCTESEISSPPHNFYSASALLAMQSAVIATVDLSVRPSVCLSVSHSVTFQGPHVPMFCPDE